MIAVAISLRDARVLGAAAVQECIEIHWEVIYKYTRDTVIMKYSDGQHIVAIDYSSRRRLTIDFD